jgi:Tfp pilus assembly protein PilV
VDVGVTYKTKPMAKKTKGGFALVDALVALTILAATLTAALSAADVGRRNATAAHESHAASVLMQTLLGQPLRAVGKVANGNRDFRWTVALANEGQAGPTLNFDLCRQNVQVISRKTGRSVSVSHLAVCPEPAT